MIEESRPARDIARLLDERLQKRREVLDSIENVFRLGKGRMERRAELARIEKVRHFDPLLAWKSFQDPRLFARDQKGQIRLERMYDEVPFESLDTYENRFALFLLRRVNRELSQAIEKVDAGEGTLSFLKGRLSYGRYGTLALLRQYLQEQERTREDFERRIELLRALHRKSHFLLESDFCQQVQEVSFASVQETNLLRQQKDFSRLLAFYRREEKAQQDLQKDLSAFLRENIPDASVTRDGLTYRLPSEGLLSVEDGKEKSEYQLSLRTSLFFPEIVLRHGKEQRSLSLLELQGVGELLSSLALLVPSEKKDSCPICHNPLLGESCPLCHAEVALDEKGRFFVKNVPFIHIGG